jgi:hypothetical protein
MEAMVQVLPPSTVCMALATTPVPIPRVFLKFGSAVERWMVTFVYVCTAAVPKQADWHSVPVPQPP